jgi:hypothetical protein
MAAVIRTGMKTGTAMPRPGTGLASQCITSATMAVAINPLVHNFMGGEEIERHHGRNDRAADIDGDHRGAVVETGTVYCMPKKSTTWSDMTCSAAARRSGC